VSILLLIVVIGLAASFLADAVTFRSGPKAFYVTFWAIAIVGGAGTYYFFH
jgi:hypothetical protein